MVHEGRLTETINAIPTTVSPTDREAAEAELARHARSFQPTALHKIGLRILGHLDPDGPAPPDEQELAPAAGELRFWERRDGRLGLEGYLEPEHSVAFRSLIEQLATPRPAANGMPDARTSPETADVFSPVVIGHQECARHITGSTGLMAVKPVLTIVYFCVKRTIGTCTTQAGTSSSTTVTSNSSHPRS